jgi:hypothetical protein
MDGDFAHRLREPTEPEMENCPRSTSRSALPNLPRRLPLLSQDTPISRLTDHPKVHILDHYLCV